MNLLKPLPPNLRRVRHVNRPVIYAGQGLVRSCEKITFSRRRSVQSRNPLLLML